MYLVGIIIWIVDIGLVEICLEISMMSYNMTFTREGHLE